MTIADRVLSNPRTTKNPSAIYCSPAEAYRRNRTAYASASLASDYHWAEIFLAAAGLPDDQEAQALLRRFRDSDEETSTAAFIAERDGILSRKIPVLRARGLLPVVCTKEIQALVNHYRDHEEVQSFWSCYLGQTSLSIEATAAQNTFIEGLQFLLGRDLTDGDEITNDELEIDADIGVEVVNAVVNNEAVVDAVYSSTARSS